MTTVTRKVYELRWQHGRKSGHGGDHATARYDVQWAAKETP